MEDEDFARDSRIDMALEEAAELRVVVCPDPENCTAYGEHYRQIQEGRCIRCGNYRDICGHDLPFADRIKTIAIDRSSLEVR